MKFIITWIILGLVVSCSSRAEEPTWIMEITAIDATNGNVVKHYAVRKEDGTLLTFESAAKCVKAGIDMGPIPVKDGVAISSVACHKVDHL